MKYKLVVVGKLKEKFWIDATTEYIKRLGRFCNVETIEIAECRLAENESDSKACLLREAESILPKLEGYVVVLDIDGKQLSSEQLSDKLSQQRSNSSIFTFVIGSSYGLADSVKERADIRLSFGAITLPHNLARVVLLEQLYRANMIESGSKYHK